MKKAPQHLQPATRKWWSSVINSFELEEHHVRLLTLAAEAWDRSVQAREILAKEGLTYLDRFNQPCSRPEVTIERDSRIAFARLVRELDLYATITPTTPRPPASFLAIAPGRRRRSLRSTMQARGSFSPLRPISPGLTMRPEDCGPSHRVAVLGVN